MKNSIWIAVLLINIQLAKAQKSDTFKGAAADTSIYTATEHQPEFPGGIGMFYKFVGKTFHYPAKAREENKQEE